MRCLLIYDISDDRARQRVADACLDFGLQRVQFSAFTGELSRTHQRALFVEIRRRLGRKPGNIQFFPFSEQTWQERRTIEQGG